MSEPNWRTQTGSCGKYSRRPAFAFSLSLRSVLALCGILVCLPLATPSALAQDARGFVWGVALACVRRSSGRIRLAGSGRRRSLWIAGAEVGEPR